jgi:hypothetical protein
MGTAMVCDQVLRRKTIIVLIILLVCILLFTTRCIDKGHRDLTLSIWVLKTDAGGSQQWMSIFNGDPNGRGHAIIQTRNGEFVIAGTGTESGKDGLVPSVVRLDGKGNLVSNVTFGTPPDSSMSLVEATDGGYIIAQQAGILTHVNEHGNILWSAPLGGGSDDWEVILTPDGGYRAAGNNMVISLTKEGNITGTTVFDTNRTISTLVAESSGDIITGGKAGADAWIARVNTDGKTVFDTTISRPPDLYNLRVFPDGTYRLIIGTTRHTGNATADLWVTETAEISLTADGRQIGESPVNASRIIVATNDSGYAYSGFVVPAFTEFQPIGYPGSQLRVVRLDEGRNVAWDESYDIGDDKAVSAIIQTADGGFAILGTAYNF